MLNFILVATHPPILCIIICNCHTKVTQSKYPINITNYSNTFHDRFSTTLSHGQQSICAELINRYPISI